MSTGLRFELRPGGALRGRLKVPGDKSISHRAIMLSAIAEGDSVIGGFLEGEDSLATLAAFRAMEIGIEGPVAGEVLVRGRGLHGLRQPAGPLDLGNSGTSMRLLAGMLSGQRFPVLLTGDDSLSRRPMRRVTDPLARMGARIEATTTGTPPLAIAPVAGSLTAIDYRMPMASAQVKSCLLLAGLYADGTTRVHEPAPTRDHTERMLRGFGYDVYTDGACVSLAGGGRLHAARIAVPGDFSSATFFLVGASIAPGSDLLIEGVGVNPTRTGALEVLRLMGADITVEAEREIGGEPIADLRVRSAPLSGVRIPRELVPLAIDEFPVLFIAAACAEGVTVLEGAEELRVKESDRIAVMAEGLRVLGAEVEPTPDGMVIRGGKLGMGEVQSRGDHRIAMAFAVAALRAAGNVEVDDCDNVRTSFPGFAALAARAGLSIAERSR